MEALLEELSLNAWPAVRQVHFDNWVLRFSGGHTRRANSVAILGPSALPLEFKIAFCEEAYSRFGMPTVFKFADTPATEELEQLLADSGYRSEGNALVMTRDLTSLGPVPVADFRIESDLSADWFDLAVSMTAIEKSRKAFFEKILSAIVPTHGFASVWHHGNAAAIGMGVIERGWVGLFDIVTAPERRREGHATNLVLNMMRWGKKMGADAAYLQVVKGNDAAVRLYEGLGFTSAYEYWYLAKRH